MDEKDFEGTLVLEQLASMDKLDEFWEAIDSDDFKRAATLMRSARIDNETVTAVLKKMSEADGQH